MSKNKGQNVQESNAPQPQIIMTQEQLQALLNQFSAISAQAAVKAEPEETNAAVLQLWQTEAYSSAKPADKAHMTMQVRYETDAAYKAEVDAKRSAAASKAASTRKANQAALLNAVAQSKALVEMMLQQALQNAQASQPASSAQEETK